MPEPKLLIRDDFRNGVFERDGHKCVFCEKAGKDAHHILERRLFPDGGYYLENGVSVCEEHHLKCESTEISVEDVRYAAGIKQIVMPPHLYRDQIYDKWGNPVLSTGFRAKGELFHDESVQKIIKPYLPLFTNMVKYPRTYHLPWSENMGEDDRMHANMDAFTGKEVIATIKMDGENTTLYSDYIHARALENESLESRRWVKGFWSTIMGDIPEGWRICGENLFAKHSIAYNSLPSYFMGFSIWNEKNICLSWKETCDWFSLLGIAPVLPFYNGVYDEKKIREAWKSIGGEQEGYVIRPVGSFAYGEFKTVVGKYVRKNHAATVVHNMKSSVLIQNHISV
jgi:hypothetical protein